MDRAIYDPGTKTIMLQFDRTVIQLDVEDLLPMMEALDELFASVMEDPDVQIGTVTEEDGTITKENQEFQAASGKLTVETVVDHLRSRGSAFILGEGARNKKSPLIVQGFEKGAAFMYEQAVKADVKVKIVTAGVYYDGSARRATVAVNGLFEFDPEQRFSGPRSRYLQQATQLCVNRAFEAATSRR